MQAEERDAAYLWDMLEAAKTVRRFTAVVSLERYLQDEMLQLAVERKVEVIGEAAGRVSDDFKRAHPEIPWRSIVGQRNVLAHKYGEIKQDRMWSLAVEHIPQLIAELEPLIPPAPHHDS